MQVARFTRGNRIASGGVENRQGIDGTISVLDHKGD